MVTEAQVSTILLDLLQMNAPYHSGNTFKELSRHHINLMKTLIYYNIIN